MPNSLKGNVSLHDKTMVVTTTQNTAAEERQLKSDRNVLKHYLKTELFQSFKWIYRQDLLETDGKMFKDYMKKCRPKMGPLGMSMDQSVLYSTKVWMRAVEKNIQRDVISCKRSGVYTVMQNKFTGEYNVINC